MRISTVTRFVDAHKAQALFLGSIVFDLHSKLMYFQSGSFAKYIANTLSIKIKLVQINLD